MARDSIDVWRLDPITGATERVGAELVAHNEQDVWLGRRHLGTERLKNDLKRSRRFRRA